LLLVAESDDVLSVPQVITAKHMYGDMLHRGGDAAGALAQYEEARSFYVQVRNGNAYLFCVVKCNVLIETLTI
jgi:hypothetical protein